ncbi:MAG: tRNA guanosine(34) transglycosylase Tgt [Rickettsiales bacterium]|nr:tRNA guanosine(34) transglycosylase Tgt [Rickettsiales bacterium]
MKNLNFLIKHNDGEARAGFINTFHGSIKTPVFMPVGTLGSVKAIFPENLSELDIEIILANTYHLMLRPGEDLIKRMGGLQKFINWNKPILTDSGGFQIWSLSKLSKINEDGIEFSSHIDGKKFFMTPEKSIKIQEKLNSDISMVLDECTEFPATFGRASDSMNMSIRWAKRCKNIFKQRNGFNLFGIVQGGMFNELRKKCAQELVDEGFDGYAIGGLSVGESHTQMIDIVATTTTYLPKDRPRYLMGVGRPVDIFEAVERGIDMFDCVLPTRFGRNGRAFTLDGEINLRNSKYSEDKSPLDINMSCLASKNFSKAYIHHLTKNNEILASMILSLHNIAFYKKMMTDIRISIEEKKFSELKKKYLDTHGKFKKY